MNEMDPIEEELCQAGIASPVSPLVVKLDKFRIMSDTDVPPEEYMTNKPEAYQISSEKADTFNQDYIIRNDANARLSWEWNLKKLFGDAMDDSAEMGLDALQDSVMSLSGIKQPKYYDKVFKLAADQRVVQTTMDRYGRVVVIPVTS